ncbi:MAG: hypothetical protein V1492_03490 [Candidatus Micrarchaeota archaeon]
MVRRSRGSLSKSTKRTRKTTKVTVSAIAKKFKMGEKVVLSPSHVSSGRFPRRYAGRHGSIVELRGGSYMVEIYDGGKKKQFVTTSLHLARSR